MCEFLRIQLEESSQKLFNNREKLAAQIASEITTLYILLHAVRGIFNIIQKCEVQAAAPLLYLLAGIT